MGALTNIRKRRNDYFKSILSPSFPIDQSPAHMDKKTKISVSTTQIGSENVPPQSSDSISSKTRRYPDRKLDFVREVHAPVTKRFGSFSAAKKSEPASSSKENAQAEALRVRRSRYETAQKAKEKEIIEIDDEDPDDSNPDDPTDDSSVEEMVILDDVVGSKRKGPRCSSPELKVNSVWNVRSLNSSVVTNSSNAVAKVDNWGKAVIKPLYQGEDDSGLPLYKRLYNGVQKRSSSILDLISKIEFCENRLKFFSIFHPKKEGKQLKKVVTKECFVELQEEEENEVVLALYNSNRRKVLVSHERSNIDITVDILQCLQPGAWLNDEVINLYFELLKEREKRESGKFLKCHFFNTFFYKKLISGRGGYNFQSVRRWTTQRKLGYNLLECEKIFVPVHRGNHWCLAVINKKDEMFQYLDSLKGIDCQVLNVLARYFVDEVKDKCGKDIDVGSWEREFVTNLPVQLNGYDCGVFMIKYADFYSRDVGLCFSQDNMKYFRLRTAKEILKLRAE